MSIVSKPATDLYREGWDRIFGGDQNSAGLGIPREKGISTDATSRIMDRSDDGVVAVLSMRDMRGPPPTYIAPGSIKWTKL